MTSLQPAYTVSELFSKKQQEGYSYAPTHVRVKEKRLQSRIPS